MTELTLSLSEKRQALRACLAFAVVALLGLAACRQIGPKPGPPKMTSQGPVLPHPKPLLDKSWRWPLDTFFQAQPRWALDFYPESLTIVAKRKLTDDTARRLQDIYGYIAERRPMHESQMALILLGDQQKMYMVCRDNERLWVQGVYAVSTAKDGFAECSVEYHTTPIGLHVVYDKHGSGLAPGTVLESRLDSGVIAEISTDRAKPVTATVTTRAIIMSGREPRNGDTYEYQIYLHGTTREYSLGFPDSSGCIRLRNSAIIEIFDLAPMDTPIFIDGKPKAKKQA